MTSASSGRDTRPLRILLVSEDDEFAQRVCARAAKRGVQVAHVAPEDDLELAAFGHGANVVVLDADAAPRRRARAATAFAGTHPDVTVVLATTSRGASALGGVPLAGKESVDVLLRDIDRAHCGRVH